MSPLSPTTQISRPLLPCLLARHGAFTTVSGMPAACRAQSMDSELTAVALSDSNSSYVKGVAMVTAADATDADLQALLCLSENLTAALTWRHAAWRGTRPRGAAWRHACFFSFLTNA